MTAVTPSVAANLLANTGSEVIAVIGNPTPFPDTPPAIDLQTVRTRAVCVARLDPVKGHKYLLAAWKLLSDRGYECELDLVGEGPLREELEAQAQRDGIQHSVRFLGFSADVRSIVEKSLFAILASETEGQGLVTVEAAAAGRPSLLTLVAGSVDLLPPDRKLTNGVAFGHPMELAHALEEWFTNAADVVREGQLFFTFLKASGDAGKIAEEYKTVYRTLSAGNTACGL
jgi:glycosyltransferase involved in cell wall biosynthesis